MNYYIYGYTDAGSVRDHNEDAVLVDRRVSDGGSLEAAVAAPFITAVCDGVGGENAGEQASGLCLEELARVNYSSSADLKRILLGIHTDIKKKGVSEAGYGNMQTTLCALAVDENGKALCVNVGDSRMYRYVNGTVRQISVDQSYGQFMYEKGQIDSTDELAPEYRSGIISAMGSSQSDPEIAQTPLITEFGEEPDDMMIIVSDGVSDFVSEGEMEIGLSMDLPVSEKIIALAKLAVMNGSTDNVSVIGIKPYIDDEELRALTVTESQEKTVNIAEVLAETDSLGDILSIDVDEIVGSGNNEDLRRERVGEEELALETHDLFMQAQASISRLSRLFDDKKQL